MEKAKWFYFGVGEGEVPFTEAMVVYMPVPFGAKEPSVSVWMVPK